MHIVAFEAAVGMQRKQPCVVEVQDKPEVDIVDVVADAVVVVDKDIEVLQIPLPNPFCSVHFAFVPTYTNRNQALLYSLK
jgi:hypothetical protein